MIVNIRDTNVITLVHTRPNHIKVKLWIFLSFTWFTIYYTYKYMAIYDHKYRIVYNKFIPFQVLLCMFNRKILVIYSIHLFI